MFFEILSISYFLQFLVNVYSLPPSRMIILHRHSFDVMQLYAVYTWVDTHIIFCLSFSWCACLLDRHMVNQLQYVYESMYSSASDSVGNVHRSLLVHFSYTFVQSSYMTLYNFITSFLL